MRLSTLIAVALLSCSLGAPRFVAAQDREDDRDEKREDRGVIDEVKKIPKRVDDALGELKKELDPKKVQEIKQHLEKILEQLKSAVDPRTERVKVHVGGQTMEVPAKKGQARLY